MTTNETELTFEAALAELEQIVATLEQGELQLEEALKLFDRGQELASYCNEKLESASLHVESLTADGEIVQLGEMESD